MAEKWQVLKEEPIARDDYLEVPSSNIELPNGERLDGYLTLTEKESVHIVPITAENEMLLVRQYRYGIDDWSYECPAGFLEADDSDPLERAKRELREETGYKAEQWIPLGVVHPTINRMHKAEYCFLALDAHEVGTQQLDETESAEWQRVSLKHVRAMIAADKITSASGLAALSKAFVTLEELRGT